MTQERTTLQNVADCVAGIQISEADAARLAYSMAAFKNTYSRSHRDLMRIPGFAKLWDALEEMQAIKEA